jgi:dTDP-glucose pyrophosphorylase
MSKLQILIPMSGAASRFISAGYKSSKPLIDVNGLPMIVRVIDNLPQSEDFIFIIRSDFHDSNRLKSLLLSLKPSCKIIEVNKLTDGAAATCLLAKEFINNDDQLLIANCDQIQSWEPKKFAQTLSYTNNSGIIITFTSAHPNNSYVELNDNFVIRCAEKTVISNVATTGIYAWKKGSDFIQSAEAMIAKNIRTKNEFYVCPTYNELIAAGKKISIYHIDGHFPIGTPEDLRAYLENR